MSKKEELDEIKAKKEEWEEKHQNYFKMERKREFLSADGVSVNRLYTPLDLAEKRVNYLRDLGFPGEYPFTRGPTPSGYRERCYASGQQTGHSTVEETNKLIKDMIAAGNEMIAYSVDTPSKLGYDSDNPLIRGEVGKCGIAWDSLEDIEILLDGIDMGQTDIYFTCIPVTIVLLAMHVAAGEKQGYRPEQLRIWVQNDILNSMEAIDEGIFPLVHGMRLAVDVLTYMSRYMPKSSPLFIIGYNVREAGADPIQQVAQSLSAARTYLKAALKRGFDIDTLAPRVRMADYVVHRDFLREIARIRATRRIWARIMKEEFGAKNPDLWQLYISGSNGGSELTPGHPEMNIVRIGIATLAAALAGVQRIAGATFDEPMGIPNRKAIATKIMTSRLIADECGVMDTIDPLGGSYYIEYLTSEIEEKVNEYMQRIEDMGGMLEAVSSGYLQREMVKSAWQRQKRIENGEEIMIGINKFVSEEPGELTYYKPNPKVVEIQTAKLKRLREKRDNEKVQRCLDNVRAVAAKQESEDNNLVFPVLEAVKAYATLGEIVSALKDVFGEYRAATGII